MKVVAPNWESSATSRFRNTTLGRGKTETESEAKRTGRPSVCEALAATRAWTRGRSTSRGTATIAAAARSTAAATMARSHFTDGEAWLRGLDRGHLPRIRADGTREGPELLQRLPVGRGPGHHRARRVVHGVVENGADKVHGH